MDDVVYWIWLSKVLEERPDFDLIDFMSIFASPEEVYFEMKEHSGMFNLTEKEKNSIKSYSLEQAQETLTESRKHGIDAVSYSSEKYPDSLRYINDPPPMLYYKGNIDCLSYDRIVTSVGTRRPLNYSMKAAEIICSELAENGVIIASGFAVGIDIISHIAAFSHNMPTICVAGCGLGVNYPSENFSYRRKVLETGGVFISEFPLMFRAGANNFPKRNRILAALGRTAMIFQAAADSGAIITANKAAEQGKEVFCLPPADIFSKSYAGNVSLLREGAIPLLSSDDVLDYLDMNIPVVPEKSLYNNTSGGSDIPETAVFSVKVYTSENSSDCHDTNTISTPEIHTAGMSASEGYRETDMNAIPEIQPSSEVQTAGMSASEGYRETDMNAIPEIQLSSEIQTVGTSASEGYRETDMNAIPEIQLSSEIQTVGTSASAYYRETDVNAISENQPSSEVQTAGMSASEGYRETDMNAIPENQLSSEIQTAGTSANEDYRETGMNSIPESQLSSEIQTVGTSASEDYRETGMNSISESQPSSEVQKSGTVASVVYHKTGVNKTPIAEMSIIASYREISLNDVSESQPSSEIYTDEDDETDIQDAVLNLLEEESPLHADIIALKLKLNPTELMTALTELELIGAVKSMAGKMFGIKK